MIELEGVSKVYTTREGEVRALDDLTLRVERAEFVAVRGPSGCGKTTLLTLVGGLALPTEGNVRVAEQVVSGMTASQRAEFRAGQIGFVFQMFHLLPYLDVLGNVLIAASDGRKQEANDYAAELLDRFGLGDRLRHRPGQLSAGERQRVAMARALLNRPQVLLADEPTGNLDPDSAGVLLDLLAAQVESGVTILLVTHEEHAAKYAQRTILLRQGRLDQPASA